MIASKSIRTGFAAGFGLAVMTLLAAPPASAQEGVDPRWLPWLGCWEAMDEGADEELLCVRADATGEGIELLSTAGGEVTDRQSLRAGAAPREIDREGCAGTQRAGFSDDGHRVYVHARYRCASGVERVSTGLFAMTSPADWVHVEVVEVGGRTVPWVKQYRLAREERVVEAGFGEMLPEAQMAVQTARVAAAAPLTVDDLVEATSRVGGEPVRAWIAERNEPMELDADRLVRMADAGVPPDVIDVVVAVSYPERFVVDRGPRRGYDGRRGYGWFGYRYPYYRYRDWMYYSPYGYGGYYGYYGYRGYHPGYVVVVPRDGGGSGHGRVVRGRGYTQGSGSGASAPPPSGSRPSAGSSGGASSGSPAGRSAKPRGGGSG